MVKYRKSFESNVLKLLLILGVISFTLLSLLPLFWVFLTSMKDYNEIYHKPPIFIPERPLDNLVAYYSLALIREGLGASYLNSLYVSTVKTLAVLAISIPCAYALVRLKFRGRTIFQNFLLSLYAFPGVGSIIPLYMILVYLRLRGTLEGLIPVYIAGSLPFAIYLLGGYFKQLPPEIEEAALVDGATRLQTILKIIIPLSLPSIISVGLFVWMWAWNEFFFAFITLSEPSKWTLGVRVRQMEILLSSPSVGIEATGVLMAAIILVSIPVIALFLYLERYLQAGLTAGAVKF